MKQLTLIWIMLAFLFSTTTLYADLMTYVAKGNAINSEIYLANLDTGEETFIGTVGPLASSLEYLPSTGRLYTSCGTEDHRLIREISVAPWDITGSLRMWNHSGPFDSMAFGPDDILYGHVGGGYGYCWLDPKSFATSTIAQPVVNLINPSGPGTAIAISNDGMGVGWGRFSTTGDQLYTFDISTGGITFLGNLPVSGEFVALDYTQDGRLLGLTGNCAIYEIDIDSLAITHLRSFENTGVTYGFAVVPEPTTLLLLGLGGLALRKRK